MSTFGEIWIFIIYGLIGGGGFAFIYFLVNLVKAPVQIHMEQIGEINELNGELSELRESPAKIEIGQFTTTYDPGYLKVPIKNISNNDIDNAIAYLTHFELIEGGLGNLLDDGRIAIPTDGQMKKQIENPNMAIGRFHLDAGDTKGVVPLEIRTAKLGRTILIQTETYSDRQKHIYPFGKGCIVGISCNPGRVTAAYRIVPTGSGFGISPTSLPQDPGISIGQTSKRYFASLIVILTYIFEVVP